MKMFKKSMSILLVAMMLLASFTLCSFAADDVKVSLRIEGIDKCLFYGDVTAKADATVLDVIKAASKKKEKDAQRIFCTFERRLIYGNKRGKTAGSLYQRSRCIS